MAGNTSTLTMVIVLIITIAMTLTVLDTSTAIISIAGFGGLRPVWGLGREGS